MIPALALVRGVCAAYASLLHHGFHCGDYHAVVNGLAIRRLSKIPSFLLTQRYSVSFSQVRPADRLLPGRSPSAIGTGHGLRHFHFHIGVFLIRPLQLIGTLVLTLSDQIKVVTPPSVLEECVEFLDPFVVLSFKL